MEKASQKARENAPGTPFFEAPSLNGEGAAWSPEALGQARVPAWRLELLGGLRVRRLDLPEAPPVERFRTQKVALLLAFLGLRRGPQRRELLCELFWPDSSLEDARNSLRVSLSGLRQRLEPPGITFFDATRDTIALSASVPTDVELFASFLERARRATGAARRSALNGAFSLYTGPLLRGYYPEWLAGEEGRLEDDFLGALGELLPLWEEAGQPDRALQAARHAVAAAPLREEAMAHLLRLGVQNGQATGVAREWKAWQRRAARAGVVPGATTLELARAALHPGTAPRRAAAPSSMSAASAPNALLGAATVAAPRAHALPQPWTTFFDRATELATLHAWLNDAATRLITLSGPGGAGKTRLALETARRLSPANWTVQWVALADLPVASLLPGAVLSALSAPRGDESLATVSAALRGARTAGARQLLVLDNFEHLCDDGAPLVRALLDAAPELIVLVTSRRPLGFSGEKHWSLQPLAVPNEPGSDALTPNAAPSGAISNEERRDNAPPCQRNSRSAAQNPSDAAFPASAGDAAPDDARFGAPPPDDAAVDDAAPSVLLFLDRARLARPGLALDEANRVAVRALCARLDGLPLALELAAARVALFSPAQILAELERQSPRALAPEGARDTPSPAPSAAPTAPLSAALSALDWANGDRAAPPRHRSLRTAIAWSERQLPPAAARFWAQLSTFRGGWTLEAAAFVCDERDAAPLILMLRDASLLFLDTRRAVPRGALLGTLREYGAERLSSPQRDELAQRHARYFSEWVESIAPHLSGPHGPHWLEQLALEEDNLRAALEWLLLHDASDALRLATALWWSWELRGHIAQGRAFLSRALEAAHRAFPDLQRWQNRCDAPLSSLENAAGTASLSTELVRGEALGAAFNGESAPAEGARDDVRHDVRDGAQPISADAPALEEATAPDGATREWLQLLARAHNGAGKLAISAPDFADARAHLTAALRLFRALSDALGAADCLYSLGFLCLKSGDLDAARELCDESVAIYRAQGERAALSDALFNRALVALYEGDIGTVRAINDERLTMHRAAGEVRGVALSLENLGLAALFSGELEAARAYLDEALSLFEGLNEWPSVTRVLWGAGHTERAAGHAELARELLGRALHLARDLRVEWTLPYLIEAFGYLAAAAGESACAARLLGGAALWRETHHEPLHGPIFRREWDATLAALGHSMGESLFQSAWQLGRALSTDALIALALEG